MGNLLRVRTLLPFAAKKSRSQFVARNRMQRFRFRLVAREPQLICGAKGRASLQRSIDYHTSPGNLHGNSVDITVRIRSGTGQPGTSARSVPT